MDMPQDRPLRALNRVLASIDSVRNGRALFALLGSFSIAGLLLAMAESSLVRSAGWWGIVEAGLAFTVAFYGGNAAGLLVMDDAQGRARREVADAVRDALTSAHRLLLVLIAALLIGSVVLGLLLALLWLCRLPFVGPLLFGAVVPLGVVVLGLVSLTAVAVVGPLAAPAVWSGLGVRATLRFLARQVLRQRLLFAALLSAAVSLLTAAVAALVSFGVIAGGRAVAALAVLVVGVDLPPQQLMAGLFGFGLRSLGAAGAPAAQNAHGAAALVGGGLVFALALVLPGVVYLRGVCSAFLALQEADTLH